MKIAKESYVNLTVNPCKMCMPMGVATALYGIKNCMTILHGSQGCSTYIRRHMATHYNEPVDIASSSLTEEGTVYGGENNLIKGIENLIKLYNPEVIGIGTTCLAETIGEDVKRLSKIFYEKHPEGKVKLIPIQSPGYGGTQFGGYFTALRALVENVEMNSGKNEKVNIVTGPISSADTRHLKEILDDFDIDYILLPDISENLDGGHSKKYNRLPSNGTSIDEIGLMTGAKATIELTTFIKEEYSVGSYLEEEFGVKNYRINVPRGLRDTDSFLKVLAEVSGNSIPEKYKRERERYLDAMIDSHKYNAEARIAIFGEPDFVYSCARLAIENGSVPMLIATADVCPGLEASLRKEVDELSNNLFADKCVILDRADFKVIEKYVLEADVNVMLGSSDGRRIEEKHKVPLVRAAFPIHDRIGGQRILSIGYEGSLNLSDQIANVMLAKTESTFREDLYNEYYKEGKIEEVFIENDEAAIKEDKKVELKVLDKEIVAEKTKTHPCFSCSSAHKYARMHLPIAPKCNVSCNYCLRKFDCVNESRPGVTTEVLSPEEAFAKYKLVKSQMDNLKVVGIAGPGDALANFDNVKKTLELIREHDPEVTFCLSTNGLMLPFYAQDLIDLGVSHVTITMNAIDPKITAKVYKFVDYLGITYTGEEGAQILLNNQLSGLKYLADRGIMCKVNIVMLKGINDHHIEEVVKKVKDLGASITNIMQMIPVKGSVFENMPLTSNKEIMDLRKKCGEHLEQMYHCKQCRADAIGLLGDDQSQKFNKPIDKVTDEKPLRFAIASKSGIGVDMHFGHATEFIIYEYKNGDVKYIEKRDVEKYCNGKEVCEEEEDKFAKLSKVVHDCSGVICLRIGDEPKKKFKNMGIEVFMTCETIETAVIKAAEAILKGTEVKEMLRA
ncbi:nitrogenase cofactor biosynthesis protein NifB [Clostridium saccharoperbutylacetonicum]|uniref:nitrogenase cofactor biosynthesis protein NifB n=1 Tax=Clostridium saccharoperbutylacetonicum TaxID=36745 RepID=UPI0039ED5B79